MNVIEQLANNSHTNIIKRTVVQCICLWHEQVTAMRDELADVDDSKIVHNVIQQKFEDIYQRALRQFKEHSLTYLDSFPAATAALEALTTSTILQDWWPETVR